MIGKTPSKSSNVWKIDGGLSPDGAGEDVGAGACREAGDLIQVFGTGERAQFNDPAGGDVANSINAFELFNGGGVEVDFSCNFRIEQGVDLCLFESGVGAELDEPVGIGFRPEPFAL